MNSRAGWYRLPFVCVALIVVPLLLSCGGGGSVAPGPGPGPTPTPTPVPPALREVAGARDVMVGAAAVPTALSEAQYASTLATEYSQLTAENVMKFEALHPGENTYDYAPADQLVAFAQNHNMIVRGHCLVWHAQNPKWLTDGAADGTYDPGELSTILQNHIANVSDHYAGDVRAWDVVNEAFSDNGDGSLRSSIWYDQPGIGFAGQGTKYIEQAFQWAHAADPDAKLFYNDYGFETGGAKADAIYNMASDFKARGVPLDGIGFQLHVGLWFNSASHFTALADTLKRFSDLGLEVHITELDVALSSNDSASLAQQAEIYEGVTKACLATPNCTSLQTWGFTDKYSWIPWFTDNTQGWALPFDANYNKKPAYHSMYNAFLEPQ